MFKKIAHILFLVIALAFVHVLLSEHLIMKTRMHILNHDTVISTGYREQYIGEEMLSYLDKQLNPGKYVGIYLLETKYGYQPWSYEWKADSFQMLEQKWKQKSEWNEYKKISQAIWDDVTYFPVPEFTNDHNLTVSYVNTWMSERSYGGTRGHEGTDIMALKNERGIYPIISMTDGVVEKMGWLDKGGYRIGIKSPGGAYFYYAHLDSYANLTEGDVVKAGDILGYMGDSGYGEEGTVGQFAVHLHLGIYIYPNSEEVSINPYWILRYIEKNKVKCYTEK